MITISPSLLGHVSDLIGIGGVISVASYMLRLAKNGTKAADVKLVQTLNTSIAQEIQNNNELRAQLGDQAEEIMRLRKMNEAESRKLQSVVTVLENRDPVFQEKLKDFESKVDLMLEILVNNKDNLPHLRMSPTETDVLSTASVQ